jgi:putative ABC transport system ATP-binding protein/lipoprotein-releasing system ATP-binding protein
MAIVLTDIRKEFGQPPTQVLKGIRLRIEDGEFVSFVGRSGCGKSTLLYIMSTLDQPSSGTVEIDGHNVQTLSQQALHRFRNLNMGFVFQFHHLLPELNALENVLMPALKSGRGEERRAFAVSLMGEFGLKDKLAHFPSQLSGGEQQRVAIARALVMEPKYLFADEPTGNLDSVNGAAVMALLQKINRERKMAVIFVTHDREFSALASKQVKMADGLLV